MKTRPDDDFIGADISEDVPREREQIIVSASGAEGNKKVWLYVAVGILALYLLSKRK